MIRRNTSKYTENQESLNQSSFTGLKGIDYSKAPTNNNTVLNSVNFDVDYDGGLILRKPLVCERQYYIENDIMVDKPSAASDLFIDRKLCGYSEDNAADFVYVKNTKFVKTFNKHIQAVSFINLAETQSVCFIDTSKPISDTSGKECYAPIPLILKIDDRPYYFGYNREYINTSTEPVSHVNQYLYKQYLYDLGYVVSKVYGIITTTDSIIISCQMERTLRIYGALSSPTDYQKTALTTNIPTTDCIQNNDSQFVNRYIKITFNSDSDGFVVGVCEILTPEPTYVRDSDIVFDYNLYSDYTLSVKDSYGSAYWAINGFLTYLFPDAQEEDATVKSLTQSKHSPIVYATSKTYNYYIKAFLSWKYKDVLINGTPHLESKVSDTSEMVYISWERTLNGVDWDSCTPVIVGDTWQADWGTPVTVKEGINVSTDLENPKIEYRTFEGYSLFNKSDDEKLMASEDAIMRYRPDILPISVNKSYTYRCRIFTITVKTEKDSSGKTVMVNYLGTVLSSKEYTPNYGDYIEVPNDLPNAISDNMLYHKKRLYNFGKTSKNIITVSDTDSTATPYSNIIDLDTTEDTYVTSLTPWRDYLIASTDKTIHLITAQDSGFTTKTISTYIGIPEKDGKTCVSIMNGILFKSGDKIYTLYPDASSGNETILNIHDISKPIEHLLGKESASKKNFAFSTSTAYYVFIPQDDVKNENGAVISVSTLCLKYDFTRKIWTQYVYPVDIFDYYIENVSDIKLFARTVSGIVYEFIFEQDILTDGVYGDCLTTDLSERTPIQFLLDSGQKTDNISLTKQFVESKIIVATLDSKDSFAMNVNIDIDGNAFVKHIDLNTDGALIRSNAYQTLTLGTAQDYSLGADTFNTNRQMFLRYAGKGKTIRHIISGQSLYKFKIYETFYRYKILNVKQ